MSENVAADQSPPPPPPESDEQQQQQQNQPAPKRGLSLGGATQLARSLKNLGKAASARLQKQGVSDELKQKEEAKKKAKRVDFYSDCDSEGNDPPTSAVYVDPSSIDDSLIPPPRSNDPIKLPFFKPRDRPRLRDQYASKISYEDWIEENTEDVGADRDTGKSRTQVEKLEADSDFPVGRAYFWHAFCPNCSTTYYPHVPGSWSCVRCDNTKVWQQPSDPESKSCGVCKKEVAGMYQVGAHRIRNPMSLNAHMCKRCGKVVCDNCYAPIEQNLEDWGFTSPQRVCTRCITDIASLSKPPEDDDLGTLHDEIEGTVDDDTYHHPFWAPKCTFCNVTFDKPPDQWLCTRCGRPVWQPKEAPESAKCWICAEKNPKVRCHKCGQLACNTCGAFGQPLPELGFLNGSFLSVCKSCYGGVSQRKGLGMAGDDELFKGGDAVLGSIPFTPTCQSCGKTQGNIPAQWKSSCHGRACWQEANSKEGSACAVCNHPIQSDTSDNCRRCGRLCCAMCTQYREPVHDRGFEKGKMQPVCRGCFGQHHLFEIDATDPEYWPPRCTHCRKNFSKPPDRWRCPFQCGNLVWQPLEHVMSKACWSCGKSVSSAIVNCRKCGRIVCRDCGQGRSEVVERGFTRGVEYPVCNTCKPPKTKDDFEKEKKKKEEEEKAKKEQEKKEKEKKAAAAAAPSPKRGASPGKQPPSKLPAGQGGKSPMPGQAQKSPVPGQKSPVPGGKGSPSKIPPGGKSPLPKRAVPMPKQKRGAAFID